MFNLVAAATVAAPLAFAVAAHAQEREQPVATQVEPASQQQIVSSAPSSNNPLSYMYPWLLMTGIGVPFLWLLLRTQQPPPQTMPSSLTRLISKVQPREETPEQAPLWQYYLRMTAAAMLITGMAQPLIDPQQPLVGSGPLLLVVDNGWASAPQWQARTEHMVDLINRAEREGKMVVVLPTAQPGDNSPVRASGLMTPADARRMVQTLEPMPWPENRQAALQALEGLDIEQQAAVIWLSNGLGDDGTLALVQQLQRFGSLTVMEDNAQNAPQLLVPPRADGGDALTAIVKRSADTVEETVSVLAVAEDGRVITRTDVTLAVGQKEAQATFNLPAELRNQIMQLSIEGGNSAGSVALLDERWRRRPVGMVTTAASQPSQPLLSEFHYIGQALRPYVDLHQGAVDDLLKKDLSVLVVGDSDPIDPAVRGQIDEWIRKGGTVLRFAGPRLAETSDDLVPVELRLEGGRTLGGAMSWAEPARLAPFDAASPFAGIAIPEGDASITIRQQLLAQPNLNPGEEIWARLEDGTPLVTAEKRGEGWLILVHTTASPDWSNLSMSSLFVDMLRAVVSQSQGVNTNPSAAALPAWKTLDGQGRLGFPPAGARRELTAQAIESGAVNPRTPPGFYGSADVRRAHNMAGAVPSLEPLPALPDSVGRKTYDEGQAMDLRGPLIAIALMLAVLDHAARMGQMGMLPSRRRKEEEEPAPVRRPGPRPAV